MIEKPPEVVTGDDAVECVRVFERALWKLCVGALWTRAVPHTEDYYRYRDKYGADQADLAFMTRVCVQCRKPVGDTTTAIHWCDQLEQTLRAGLINHGVMSGEAFDMMDGYTLSLTLRAWLGEIT